jgi:hypothetical protein
LNAACARGTAIAQACHLILEVPNRFLERAARVGEICGNGSLTALPFFFEIE